MATAQKGDFAAGHRALQGRNDHQDTRPHKRSWQSGSFRTHAGPSVRSSRRCPLIEGISFGGLIADKAFGSNHIIADFKECGAKLVIFQHPRPAKTLPLGKELYKWRHRIENFFCKLKESIARHACKTDQSFAGIIYLTAALINSR